MNQGQQFAVTAPYCSKGCGRLRRKNGRYCLECHSEYNRLKRVPRRFVIYKLSNRKNGKVYIGQTITALELRWASHVSDSRGRAGHRGGIAEAIRVHGSEAFEVKEIFEARSQEELDRMEAWFVFLWNSHHPMFGYNLTHDGKGRLTVPWSMKCG